MTAFFRRAERRPRGRAALVLVLALGGCNLALSSGAPPPIQALATLRLHVSTRAEVLAALGPPAGHGAMAIAGAPDEEVLVYQAHGARDGAAEEARLLVFIDHASGRYGGYLWYRDATVMSPLGSQS